MDYRCQLCFKIFQVYAINYQKKNTRQSAGHPEMTRCAFKNKKSLQISGFGQNDTKSHSEQKNIFFAKKVLKKSLSLISTFTLVSTTTKADFSATN